MNSKRKSPSFFKRIYRSSIHKLEDPLIRGKLKSQIHCVDNETVSIIFLKNAISAYSCPKPLKESLVCYLDGAPRSQACQKYSINEFELDYLLHILLEKFDVKAPVVKASSQEIILDRLVLNISNSCNLRCRYCYAGGGTYGASTGLMNEQTALTTIDRFCTLFDRVEKLQFFGGEPLLNPELIGYVCQELSRRSKNGEIARCPQFSLVTNGTIFSDEILKLLKKYDIRPTISMDGPESVNDNLRGKGTTKKTIQFIDHLERHGIDYSFEGTFTSRHVESGIYLNHLLDFFSRRFGQHELHMPPASLSSEHPLFLSEYQIAEIYREGVEFSIANLTNSGTALLSFASRILDVFVKKNPIRNYCPAGLFTLSVDANGFVYPCFMFTGRKDFQMGNVFDDLFLSSSLAGEVFSRILAHDKPHDPECQECWAAPFCSGCIGADAITNQGNSAKKSCVLTKAMVEGFLARIPGAAEKLQISDSLMELPNENKCRAAEQYILARRAN